MNWFCIYNEALHDRKLRRLPVAYRWVRVAVLAMASESPQRGALLIAGNVPATLEDMQDTAAVDLADVRGAVAAFEQQDMLARRASDGASVVVNWEKRQFISDDRKDTGRPLLRCGVSNGRRSSRRMTTPASTAARMVCHSNAITLCPFRAVAVTTSRAS